MRDHVNNFGAVSAIGPAIHAATATGAAISLHGFNAASVVINTGAIAGAGDFTATIQESDVSGSGFADVAAGDLIGTFPASLTADAVLKVGYIGHKPFVRIVLTKNAGTSIAASAVVIKERATLRPVA